MTKRWTAVTNVLCSALLVGAAMGTLSACPDNSGVPLGPVVGPSCFNSTECPADQVCADPEGDGTRNCYLKSQLNACDSDADCLGTQECTDPDGDGLSTCNPIASMPCNSKDDCDAGFDCVGGSCTPEVVAGCDPACEGTDVCDEATTTCRPCEGDECPGPDCTVDGCDVGFTCNPETKACDPDTPVSAVPCGACDNAADCGGNGWSCVPVGGANVCAPPCGTADDCTTGWICLSNQCVPSGFSCEGCALDGCEAGLSCDTGTDFTCVAEKAACDTCTFDWECGAGSACHDVGGGAKHCVPRCAGQSDCPNSAECIVDATSGYKVCSPLVTACCLDDNVANCQSAGCDPACDPAGPTPYCNAASVCVQCLSDDDCGGETCDLGTGTCAGSTGCQAPTPVFDPDAGKCVQCLGDGDCGGETCDLVTNTCAGDVCSTCVAPYPACALVGSDTFCVQCTQDVDCGQGGTCNLQTYSCEGGTIVVPDACQLDTDCDAGVSGFTLECDVASGLCVDVNGGCDDVTAFCIGGGECVSLIDALLGDIGGGLPPLPGSGGSTIPGTCSCTPSIEPIPGLGGPSPDCPPDQTCSPGLFAALIALFGGGGPFEPTYTCQESPF